MLKWQTVKQADRNANCEAFNSVYLQINVSQLLQNLTLLLSILRQLISEGAEFDLHYYAFYIYVSLQEYL